MISYKNRAVIPNEHNFWGSSGRCSRRWPTIVYAHLNIMYGFDDCYQLTRTSGGFSAQCLSKRFFKESCCLQLHMVGNQLVVILIGWKCWSTNVFKCFTKSFDPLLLVLHVIKVIIESPLALSVVNTANPMACSGDQDPGFAGGSCGFLLQESSLLLFSLPFLF